MSVDPENTAQENYIALGRVAELVASAGAFLTAGQVLEWLKGAIFRGEFDAPVSASRLAGLERLRIAVDIPECEMTKVQRALKTRVKRFYDMNRDSVASVIYCEDGLPGDQGLLQQWIYDTELRAEVFCHLVTTPLSDFPEVGQKMIADIRVSKARVVNWLAINGYPAPSCLSAADRVARPPEDPAKKPQTAACNKEPGRPELPGWRIVREHIVKSYDADPAKPFKILAYEARQEALKFCDERDTPSENTILRRMKEILRN